MIGFVAGLVECHRFRWQATSPRGGRSALHVAAAAEDAALLLALLEAPGADFSAPDANGATPLHARTSRTCAAARNSFSLRRSPKTGGAYGVYDFYIGYSTKSWSLSRHPRTYIDMANLECGCHISPMWKLQPLGNSSLVGDSYFSFKT